MKKSTFRLFLGCFCLFLGQNALFSDEKEPAEMPVRAPNPNFVRDDVATITTQKQLDSLKITEKQRQNVILELIDSQKLIAEKYIQDSKMAGPLLDRIPTTNPGAKKTIKTGKLKGLQVPVTVENKFKGLVDRNSPERRKLDFDVMIFTRDDQYSNKGDFVAMRAAIIKKQKQLIDQSNAYATGRMFCYPQKLPPVSYSGQVCSIVEGVELVTLYPEVKLSGVVTVKVNHLVPGKHPLKQYYHLVGWPEGKLSPRSRKEAIEPAFAHVDPSAVVLVGDIVNINGKQGIALAYALDMDDAARMVKASIQEEVRSSPVVNKGE